MAEAKRRLTIAVPTYRRPRLLARLLGELERQSRHPDRLVVIDGQGGMGEVRNVLAHSVWPGKVERIYAPSTHANLPFQRWLGRRLAEDSDDLIFFDDDLLLPDRHTVAKLVAALDDAAAATCDVHLPTRRARTHLGPVPLVWFRRGAPGSLTAGGARRQPVDDGSSLPQVEWLRGAVIALRCEALPAERFPRGLFALAEIGAGMGEELALARCVQGRIVFVRDLIVDHPETAPSQVLANRAEERGFAIAYSRRLINDMCRDGQPTWPDRAGLAWTWCGGLAAAVADGMASGRREAWRFAGGYLRGVLSGTLYAPTHARLTPQVDWEADARRALVAAERVEAACRATSV